MPRVEDVFNTKELINYFKERQEGTMLGESLFPERKIQDIEFDMILGKGGLPVTASVHAFDTKTQIASREAIQRGAQSLALIKRQIPLTEKEIIKIQNPRSDAELEFVLSQLYNDAEKMIRIIKNNGKHILKSSFSILIFLKNLKRMNLKKLKNLTVNNQEGGSNLLFI